MREGRSTSLQITDIQSNCPKRSLSSTWYNKYLWLVDNEKNIYILKKSE